MTPSQNRAILDSRESEGPCYGQSKEECAPNFREWVHVRLGHGRQLYSVSGKLSRCFWDIRGLGYITAFSSLGWGLNRVFLALFLPYKYSELARGFHSKTCLTAMAWQRSDWVEEKSKQERNEHVGVDVGGKGVVEMQRTIPHDLIGLCLPPLANLVLVWRCTPHMGGAFL